MHFLADFLLAVADLIESEARALRKGLLQFVVAVGVLALAFAFVVAGFGLLMVALFLGLESAMASPAAAALTGVISLAIALLLMWSAKILAR